MSALEIVIVACIGLALVLPGFFIERFKSKNHPKTFTGSQRMVMIIAGILLLGMTWILAPAGGIPMKVMVSLIVAASIYTNMKGWLFKAAPTGSRKTPKI